MTASRSCDHETETEAIIFNIKCIKKTLSDFNLILPLRLNVFLCSSINADSRGTGIPRPPFNPVLFLKS